MQVTKLWVNLQDKHNMSPEEAEQIIKEDLPFEDYLPLLLFLGSFRNRIDAYKWMKMDNEEQL
jgi:hypothetical protein